MLSKDNQVFILFSKKRQVQLETTCAKMKTDKRTHYVSHGFVHKSQKRTQSIFYGRISPQGSSVPQGDKKQLRLWLAWGKKPQPVHSGNTNLSLPPTPSPFSLKSFNLVIFGLQEMKVFKRNRRSTEGWRRMCRLPKHCSSGNQTSYLTVKQKCFYLTVPVHQNSAKRCRNTASLCTAFYVVGWHPLWG